MAHVTALVATNKDPSSVLTEDAATADFASCRRSFVLPHPSEHRCGRRTVEPPAWRRLEKSRDRRLPSNIRRTISLFAPRLPQIFHLFLGHTFCPIRAGTFATAEAKLCDLSSQCAIESRPSGFYSAGSSLRLGGQLIRKPSPPRQCKLQRDGRDCPVSAASLQHSRCMQQAISMPFAGVAT